MAVSIPNLKPTYLSGVSGQAIPDLNIPPIHYKKCPAMDCLLELVQSLSKATQASGGHHMARNSTFMSCVEKVVSFVHPTSPTRSTSLDDLLFLVVAKQPQSWRRAQQLASLPHLLCSRFPRASMPPPYDSPWELWPVLRVGDTRTRGSAPLPHCSSKPLVKM